MTRYRKVEVAMWTDGRFTGLSSAPPNAQTLWFYLLTGQRTTPLPGVIVAHEAVIASDLRWSLTGFRRAFEELTTAGMAGADWASGVVVLTRALFDSMGEPRDTARPASINVVKSWAKAWEVIPDCSLTREYLRDLQAFLDDMADAIQDAFRDAFARAIAKASRIQESGAVNSEQEQETGSPHTPQGGFELLVSKVDRATGDIGRARARRPSRSEATESELRIVRAILKRIGDRNGIAYTGRPKHIQLIVRQLRSGVTEAQLRAVVAYCATLWKDKPDMADYLRPETLFGPEGIDRYFDAACTMFAGQIADTHHAEQSSPLQLVPTESA